MYIFRNLFEKKLPLRVPKNEICLTKEWHYFGAARVQIQILNFCHALLKSNSYVGMDLSKFLVFKMGKNCQNGQKWRKFSLHNIWMYLRSSWDLKWNDILKNPNVSWATKSNVNRTTLWKDNFSNWIKRYLAL